MRTDVHLGESSPNSNTEGSFAGEFDEGLPLRVQLPPTEYSALVIRLQDAINQRRRHAIEHGIDFDGLAFCDDKETGLTRVAIGRYLRILQDHIRVQPSRVERFTTGVRAIDSLVRWFRREAHGLVVFYCNRLGARQMLFNSAVLQLLMPTEDSARNTELLAARIADLEARLADLDRRLSEVNGGTRS